MVAMKFGLHFLGHVAGKIEVEMEIEVPIEDVYDCETCGGDLHCSFICPLCNKTTRSFCLDGYSERKPGQTVDTDNCERCHRPYIIVIGSGDPDWPAENLVAIFEDEKNGTHNS